MAKWIPNKDVLWVSYSSSFLPLHDGYIHVGLTSLHLACCAAAQNFQFDLQNNTVEHNLLIMTTAILDFGEETNVISK